MGCDFSPDADKAVEYGLSVAQEFQAGLHLVHVIEPIDYKEDGILRCAGRRTAAESAQQFEPKAIGSCSGRKPITGVTLKRLSDR